MRTGNGFLIICAANSPSSVIGLEDLIAQILRVRDIDVPFVLAINKMDLDKSEHSAKESCNF